MLGNDTEPRREPRSSRVYPPREDTALLLHALDVHPSSRRRGRLLEVGTGSGAVALHAAELGFRVVASDINPHALRALDLAARAAGVLLAPVRADLLRGLRRFDLILFNPPYLPTPPGARDPDRWVNAALDGGPDGFDVTARFLSELPSHLNPRGAAYLVVSSRQPRSRKEDFRRRWIGASGSIERIASRRFAGETLSLWCLRLTLRPKGRAVAGARGDVANGTGRREGSPVSPTRSRSPRARRGRSTARRLSRPLRR